MLYIPTMVLVCVIFCVYVSLYLYEPKDRQRIEDRRLAVFGLTDFVLISFFVGSAFSTVTYLLQLYGIISSVYYESSMLVLMISGYIWIPCVLTTLILTARNYFRD